MNVDWGTDQTWSNHFPVRWFHDYLSMPRILRQIRENRAGIPTTTTMMQQSCSNSPVRWHTSKGRQAVASPLASRSSFWRRAIRFFPYYCLISGGGFNFFFFSECLNRIPTGAVKVLCFAGCPGERRGDPHGGDATEENGCSHVRAPSSWKVK